MHAGGKPLPDVSPPCFVALGHYAPFFSAAKDKAKAKAKSGSKNKSGGKKQSVPKNQKGGKSAPSKNIGQRK